MLTVIMQNVLKNRFDKFLGANMYSYETETAVQSKLRFKHILFQLGKIHIQIFTSYRMYKDKHESWKLNPLFFSQTPNARL